MCENMSTKRLFGNRKFYSLPDNPHRFVKSRTNSNSVKKREDVAKLIKYIDENVIGRNTTFAGPYGRRKVVYCDYTASGRSLQFIEEYILREVLPCYGNTHTTTSITSLQSTLFRHEARDIFRNCTHASEHDAVIFAGQGCTGAVHKLITALDLQDPPVVFVGPSEHHSNLLPWRELGAKIIRIAETKEGFLDLDDLETQLIAHRGCGSQLIGCFSAASNITGILTDDIATTILLHQYGALAFWDYAAAAPYIQLDMNPILPGVGESTVHKDAMFFSVHKFVGGVQTPGILIAKKSLFKNSVPNGCGGGTVFFVTRDSHRYLQDIELREEGGTGAIVESVRAGLVMQLKETVGSPAIMSREEKITRTVLAHIRTIPELILLGNPSHNVKRLPIFSFIVRHPRGTFLHHNFVCSVLNDVFGVQARGGCSCAGPYAQDLMGIDAKLAEEYESILLEDSRLNRTHLRRKDEYSNFEMLRPGFSRISIPYFMNDSELAFVLEAIKMVATEGWKLLPQYILNPETGEWRHHSNSVFRDRKWLGSIRYVDGKMSSVERRVSSQGNICPVDFSDCLHVARSIFNKARKMAQRYPVPDQKVMFDEKTEKLRWFMLPSEAQDLLLGNSQNVKHTVPFNPVEYCGSRGDVTPVQTETKNQEPTNTTQNNQQQQTTSLQQPQHQPQQQQQQHSDTNFSNMLNQIFSHNLDNSLSVPSIPHHLLPQRQNSFSSDLSNTEYMTELFTPPMQAQYAYPAPYTGYETTYQQQPMQNGYDDNQNYFQPVVNSFIVPAPPQPQPTTSYMYPQPTFINQGYDLFQSIEDLNVSCEQQPNSSINMSSPRGTGKVHFSLDLLRKKPEKELVRQRCNSLGSAVFLNQRRIGRSLTEADASLNLSECSLSSSSPVPDDIHAYVTEVTKELATEIKSEIREVISKVEDVLSDEVTQEHRNSRSSDCDCKHPLERTNSVSNSANDIAQYLMGVSREMAKEMKCEIREMVNSISECSPKFRISSSDVDTSDVETDKKPSELDKKEVRFSDVKTNSQSQDSGINLSYSDSTCESSCSLRSDKDSGSRNRSESLDSLKEKLPKRKISRASKKLEKKNVIVAASEDSSNDESACNEPGIKSNIKNKWHCPSKAMWKTTVEAINEFEMLKDGDRVLVCLSGGKDSLSLLHTLHQYQYYAAARGVNFQLGAVTVDPGSTAYNPRPLVTYMQSLGVNYFYEEQCILEQANQVDCTSICSFCSRMKRGRLYATARREKYNVLAFGHHLDDLAETFLMSAFHNGRLQSMKAHYYVRERDLRVIRPFVYTRERTLRQFAESRKLPVIPENCPACFTAPKERHRSKQLLAQQEILFPRLFSSIKAALRPLINYRLTGEESKFYTNQSLKYSTDSDEASLP